ncbi:long-chain fatty acid--CoA ligase [Novosphingobium sp. G106]|uniref:AMP-binding protein n=1 Tax=Novosphingobium sp. G106 TaxID=2849500 RepID=UPI001C2D347F|nr:AMP-binding protein [Novosphingobium sp. G106]MBV1688660.1 long-chain fatty acid--CoA ligase [Novosphingobium sp. G106]
MMDQLPLAHWSPDASTDLLVGTVGDTLRRTTTLFPNRRALAWPEGDGIGSMTYAELLAQAEQVAAWLLAHAPPQSRIAVWSRNSVEWILIEYGCALAGMAIASWNPAWTDFECRHARDLTDPALLLAGFDTRGEPLIGRGTAIMGDDRVFPLEDLRSLIATARAVPCPR